MKRCRILLKNMPPFPQSRASLPPYLDAGNSIDTEALQKEVDSMTCPPPPDDFNLVYITLGTSVESTESQLLLVMLTFKKLLICE